MDPAAAWHCAELSFGVAGEVWILLRKPQLLPLLEGRPIADHSHSVSKEQRSFDTGASRCSQIKLKIQCCFLTCSEMVFKPVAAQLLCLMMSK